MGRLTWLGWQDKVDEAPQPTAVIYGANLRADTPTAPRVLATQSSDLASRDAAVSPQELVEQIMGLQERKSPELAVKQKRLLEKLKQNGQDSRSPSAEGDS